MNDVIAIESSSVPADDDLQCPLCDYDLRGLTENRCPECGHAFDPDELRRTRAERQANWSFEHASRRRIVRAFVSTSLRSLLPFLFWKRLTAANAIRSRRLVWWGIAWVVLTFGAFGVAYALIAVRVHGQALPFTWNAPLVRGPVPRATWQQAIDIALANGRLSELAMSTLALIIWVPLTFFGINLFGQTLKAAGVRVGHLWRIVLYVLPSLLLPTMLAALAVPTVGTGPDLPTAIVLTSLALAAFHLALAHTAYLRIRHALGQAILITIVNLLAMLVFALVIIGVD